MADDFDFQINDLKFRAAISDELPYQRATAPFRKEQFDSSPTVGDQSLTGWWTRGQLSFHKGAGIKYYEVLEGEAVLDRYQDSEAVDVWTAGQATLHPSLSDLAVTATAAAPGTLDGASGLAYANGSAITFWDGIASTAISTSNGGTPSWLASDGRHFLAANGALIERQAVAGSARTNHVTNPSFETNATGWTGFGGSVAQSGTYSKYGSSSLKLTSSSATEASAYYSLTGLTVGVTYAASIWVYAPIATSGAIYITCQGVGASVAGRDGWVKATHTFTATATSETLSLWIDGDHAGSVVDVTGQVVYLDGVVATEFPFDGDYFDGDNLGTWTGTAHASKSTYASDDPAASYALWELSTAGHEFERVWYGKGRIWAVDNTGRWYALSMGGGTCTKDDAIWVSGKANGEWSFADSPSSVFIGEAGTVYALNVDVDGQFASGYTAPVVAAQLPAGEIISSLYHYLGYLIITTNKGVRVAVLQDDNLYYGPLTIKGDFSANTQTGAAGNLVYVLGEPEDHQASTLCALDLTTEVAQLRPAWAPVVQLNDTAATAAGALVDPSGRLFAWAGNLYGESINLSTTGNLVTGYHRFGTLDLKSFRSVSVRVGGDGGSITVYRVDADGTETNLGSVTPTEAQKTLDLQMTGPAERIALKFVLTRDGTNATLGPELLGYQIKAMPVPERQRILKWPLKILDKVELRRYGSTGRAGKAYADIKALEALESGSAVVTFTDHRTGETGSGYLDSVEFVSNTPASGASNGFGGVAMVTLRVLN